MKPMPDLQISTTDFRLLVMLLNTGWAPVLPSPTDGIMLTRPAGFGRAKTAFAFAEGVDASVTGRLRDGFSAGACRQTPRTSALAGGTRTGPLIEQLADFALLGQDRRKVAIGVQLGHDDGDDRGNHREKGGNDEVHDYPGH